MKSSPYLLFLFSGLLFLSCGPRKAERMRISSWVSSPAETRMFEATLDSFRSAQPTVDFDFEPIPGNYAEKIQLMLGTQTAPDIFFLKGTVAPSYLSFGVIQPLDSLIERDAYDVDDFFPPLLEAFQRDGKQYGLPKDFSPYVLYYNQRLMEEAGIDTLPRNWQELEEVARKLTKDIDGDGKTDQYGLVIDPSVEMTLLFVFQNGGELQKADGSLGITDDAFVEAVEFYHGLYKQGIATIPTDVGQGWAGDAFGREKAAMAFSGGWMKAFVEESYPDTEYGVAEVPEGKEKATILFTTAYAIPQASQFEEDAWQMLSYLAGKEGMKHWTSQGLALPARKSVALANGTYQDPIDSIFMKSTEYGRPFQVQFSERGFEEIAVAMQAVFFTGKAPREALEDIKSRIESYRLLQ